MSQVYDVHGHAWAISDRPTAHVSRWLLAIGVALVVAVAGVTGWAIGRAGADTSNKTTTGVQSVPMPSPLAQVGQTSHVSPQLRAANGAGVAQRHAQPDVSQIPCLVTQRWPSGSITARVPC